MRRVWFSVLFTYLYIVLKHQVCGYVRTFWWGGSTRREHCPWLGNISIGRRSKNNSFSAINPDKTNLLVHHLSIFPALSTLGNVCLITICWWCFSTISFSTSVKSFHQWYRSCQDFLIKGHKYFVLTHI